VAVSFIGGEMMGVYYIQMYIKQSHLKDRFCIESVKMVSYTFFIKYKKRIELIINVIFSV
jgi:hypothetical protein